MRIYFTATAACSPLGVEREPVVDYTVDYTAGLQRLCPMDGPMDSPTHENSTNLGQVHPRCSLGGDGKPRGMKSPPPFYEFVALLCSAFSISGSLFHRITDFGYYGGGCLHARQGANDGQSLKSIMGPSGDGIIPPPYNSCYVQFRAMLGHFLPGRGSIDRVSKPGWVVAGCVRGKNQKKKGCRRPIELYKLAFEVALYHRPRYAAQEIF